MCFALLFATYMVIAVLDSEWGFDGIVGLFFQLLWAGLISALTIVVCLVIGLPIRILPSVRHWWGNRIFIPLLLILIGIALFVLAHQPDNMTVVRVDDLVAPDDIEVPEKLVPHLGYVAAGWFLSAFGVLHLFPPERWMESVQSYLTRAWTK